MGSTCALRPAVAGPLSGAACPGQTMSNTSLATPFPTQTCNFGAADPSIWCAAAHRAHQNGAGPASKRAGGPGGCGGGPPDFASRTSLWRGNCVGSPRAIVARGRRSALPARRSVDGFAARRSRAHKFGCSHPNSHVKPLSGGHRGPRVATLPCFWAGNKGVSSDGAGSMIVASLFVARPRRF